MDDFKFEMGDAVVLTLSKEQGDVIGRAEYLDEKNCYYVRYVAADGRQVQCWLDESAIEKRDQ